MNIAFGPVTRDMILVEQHCHFQRKVLGSEGCFHIPRRAAPIRRDGMKIVMVTQHANHPERTGSNFPNLGALRRSSSYQSSVHNHHVTVDRIHFDETDLKRRFPYFLKRQL